MGNQHGLRPARGQQDRVACAPYVSRSSTYAALLLFRPVNPSFADSLFSLCQPVEFQSLAQEA